ncbi:uncharacterized protein LOC124676745 [Lolium rigidum]|uniref:uncharacterized protein LOC124654829 n=1 Tax=Lolium rigidum TaxID=89674 RepID=UPI001F5D466C|nr:uncharacterized protein LOC124654829 [Lolium rigidum]XP_047068733.1 uncharacterized protein LOC124676745 [Lolium rigidum]XP_051186763.1 uncharacterized protein LOC127300657 [Lolium perenne]
MRVLRLCLCGQEAQGAVRSVVLQILTYLMECPTRTKLARWMVCSVQEEWCYYQEVDFCQLFSRSIFKWGSLVLSPCTKRQKKCKLNHSFLDLFAPTGVIVLIANNII